MADKAVNAITSKAAVITNASGWTVSFGPAGSTAPSGVDEHHVLVSPGIRGTLTMNQNGTLTVSYSSDGSTWHACESAKSWTANTGTGFSVDTRWGAYCKLVFTPAADTSSAAKVYIYTVADAAGL